MRQPENIYSAAALWGILEQHGMELGAYTADGKSRFGKCKNGEWRVLSVHETYPDYIVDRILIETGFIPPPAYDNLN